MKCYVENYRQRRALEMYFRASSSPASFQIFDRDKSGVQFYIKCFLKAVLGRKIAIVWPRQRFIRKLLLSFDNVFFIEDGLSFLIHTESVPAARWLGYRRHAVAGAHGGLFDLRRIVSELCIELGLNKCGGSVVPGQVALIVNGKQNQQVFLDGVRSFMDITAVYDFVVFLHPEVSYQTFQRQLDIVFKRHVKVTIKPVQTLYESVSTSDLVFFSRSAISYDLWFCIRASKHCESKYRNCIGIIS